METVIQLRPLTAADAEAHVAGTDAEIVRWLSGKTHSVETTREWIDKVASDPNVLNFGVFVDNELAGNVEAKLHHPDLDEHEANIAYSVFPKFRGQGIAVFAVEQLCDRLVSLTDATMAVIRTEPDNTASIRVAEQAGFTFLESRPSTAINGETRLMNIYVRKLG